MKVKELIEALSDAPEDYEVQFHFFGVIEAAQGRGAYTSSYIPHGTYYVWLAEGEPLFIEDPETRTIEIHSHRSK